MPADAESDTADNTDTAAPKGRSWLKTLGIGALVLVVLLLGVRILAGMNTRSGVEAELELLKDAGAPMTIAELLGPDIPPEENAASDLEAAFIAMTRGSGQPYVPGQNSGTAGPAMQAIHEAADLPLSERLAAYEANLDNPDMLEALAALEAAAAKPHCRFGLAWDQGPGMLMPFMSSARYAAHLLAADALTKAAAGDEEAAWARIHQGLILARHIGETPILISYLIAIVCENIALKAAVAMQPWVHSPLPTWLLAESGHFDMFSDPELLVAAVDGERISFGSYVFERLDSSTSSMAGALTAGSSFSDKIFAHWYTSYPMKPLRNIDQRTYLALMRGYRETLVSRTFDPDVLATTNFADQVPSYCVMTNLLVPSLGGLNRGPRFMEGRLLRLALFACDYRRRTGAFPADFDALVKALPPALAAIAKDPTVVTPQQPIIYKVEDEDMTLYSYGKNGVDDGGIAANYLDVVVTATFKVPPPAEAVAPASAATPIYYPLTDDSEGD